MKGQTQAVTAVLITGVIVTSVASAYVWGVPIIQKRQGQADIAALESKVIRLKEVVSSVGSSGKGSSDQLKFELGQGFVRLYPDENYLELRTVARGAPYPVGSWRTISGENYARDVISEGEDLPGTVAAKRLAASSSIVAFRIDFRNVTVDTPSGREMRLIDLKARGVEKANGDVSVSLRNNGTVFDTGSEGVMYNGRMYDRRRRLVSVSLR